MLILVLTNRIYLDILSVARSSEILSSILLFYYFLLFSRYTIILTKILRFTIYLAKRKERETKEIAIKKISKKLKKLNFCTS